MLEITASQRFQGSTGRTKMTYPADCQALAQAEALEGHLRSTPAIDKCEAGVMESPMAIFLIWKK